MRDNARDFHEVPGPKPSKTRNVHPGFNFSYVAPVNKRFGFTLSGGISTNYSPQDNIQMTWRGAGAVTNGAAFPPTTPDKPYLSQFLIQDAPKVTTRRSVGATVDYKVTANDRVQQQMPWAYPNSPSSTGARRPKSNICGFFPASTPATTFAKT